MSDTTTTVPGGPGTSNGETTVTAGQPTSQAGGFLENLRGVLAAAVAVLLLVGFAGLVFFLVGQVGSASEGAWSRYIFLFGAAEALVFTAIGWLFGREVNRQAAQSADARADQATARAESATQEAAQQEAKGKALRAAVQARAGAGVGRGRVEERGVGGAPTGPSEDPLRELADFAGRLFPDV
jgi:hypothetical protein